MSHAITRKADYFMLRRGVKTGKLLVVFSSMKIKPGTFTFTRALASFPYDVLFVNDRNDGWYQTGVPGLGNSVDETCREIEIIAAEVGAHEIYTMGSSMGGYGALLYGARLGATSLAFDAETVLGMFGSRSAKHMPVTIPVVHRDILPFLSSCKPKSYLISGEMDPVDLKCACHVSGLSSVRVVTLADQAHSTAAHLHQEYGLSRVVEDMVEGTPLVAMPNEGDLCLYPAAVMDIYVAEQKMAAKDYDAAIGHLLQTTQISKTAGVPWFKLGTAYLHLGQLLKAAEAYEVSVSRCPRFSRAHLQLGIAKRRLKQLDEAIPSLQRAAALEPNFAASHYQLGLALREAGQRSDAENALMAAWRLAPRNTAIRDAFRSTLEDGIQYRMRLLDDLGATVVS